MNTKKNTYWLLFAIIVLLASIFVIYLRFLDEKTQEVINVSFNTNREAPVNVVEESTYPVDYCTLDYVICVGGNDVEIKSLTIKLYTKVTAYSDYGDGCDDDECITASGVKAYVGSVACPRKIPFGTHVLIDGKEYTCEDRMALKHDGWFDIFMGYGKDAKEKADLWGIRQSEIIIL